MLRLSAFKDKLRAFGSVSIALMMLINSFSFVYADETDSDPVDDMLSGGSSNRLTINDVNSLVYKLSTAPSAKEAARKSSDDIINTSTEALSGVESLGKFLAYKTMTVEDMQAFEWSFIVSQFATPLQDNIADVLNHSIFLQMAQQGLKIQKNPEATSEGVYMDDPYFDNKTVVTSEDFSKIAGTLIANTKYIRLLQDKGSSVDKTATDALSNVTLRNLCEAPVGTVFYIVDEYYTADGRDKENLFIDRLTILREGLTDDKVHRQLVKIPILVITNNVKMYLQTNIGAYMKMQSNTVGGESIPMTYNELVGTAGSSGYMGGCNLFVDTWGNILVGHDAKYKMVLPNACNPIFTNSDEVTEVVPAGYMNAPASNSSNRRVSSSGTQRNVQSESSGSYTYKYNDRNFVFNKNFVTMYTRQLRMSGSDSWQENNGSIVFLDTYRNGHYQNFLDVKKSVPNSHRNAVVIFDGMRVAYPDQIGDNFSAMIGKDGSYVAPLMYLGKDGLPKEYESEMTSRPDGSNMRGILSEIKRDIKWWDIAGWLDAWGDDFVDFMQSVFGDASKRVRTVNNAADPKMNGLYYLAHPDNTNIKDWFGSTYDNSDLPARRYFKLCFKRGVYGKTIYPDVSSDVFTYAGGDLSTMGAKGLFDSLIKQLNGNAKGEILAKLFQTYNYMYGVGLNYPPDMLIPDGAMNVDSNDTASSNDTGLSFIGKDTLDYAQDWGVFSSGENGMFVREYRPIHTGDEDLYYEDMSEGYNRGNIYSPEAFRDDIYVYTLRDTRVSDRWINYGIEDVAMISFVWLNYYIPKLLPVRTLVYTTDDSSAVSKAASYTSNSLAACASSSVFQQFREVLNKSYQMTSTDTDTAVFGGYSKTTFKNQIQNYDDVIMGPYPDLIRVDDYTLYPDTVPMALNSNHYCVVYNPLEQIMGLYRNTAWSYNSSDIPAIQVTSRDVDSTEILATIWDFLKHPVTSIVNIIAGGMQMAYNGIAGSDIANVFGATWIKDSRIYQSATGIYYFVVGILAIGVAIYLIIKYVISRKESLTFVLSRVLKTIALSIVPLVIFNATLSAISAISVNLLQEPNMKIAAVETELAIRDRFNNDAGYEASYQSFKEQFDMLVDTSKGFGILIPDYYVEGTDSVIYRHVPLKTLNENLRYNNSSIWYDHRGFVPVHRNYYKDSLFYYFYDYIKYQYLYYLAETPQADLAGQQEFAARFEFADKTSANDGDWLGQGSRGAYINFCDTQLLRSQGAYFTMMRDPNYVYGSSIANKASGRWENAYLQDLFGLGYLFQDTGEESEPINQVKQGVTWRVFKEHDAFIRTKFIDPLYGQERYEYANTAAYMQYVTQKENQATGYASRNKPYASYVNLYRDYRYIKEMDAIPITGLEADLMQLNENIYRKVIDLIYYDTAEMHDEAFIVQAALIATFETNKMFGARGFLEDPIGPVGFDETSVSIDKVIRVMFAKGMDDIAEERNVMYMITGNGSGIATALIVLLALGCVFISMIARTLLIATIGLLTMILCVFFYVFKQQHKRKLGIGVTIQCAGLLLTHILTILFIKGIISVAVSNTNGLMQFFYAILFFCVCLASLVVHLFLAKCMFKNLGALGGDLFSHYAGIIGGHISGVISGASSGGIQNTGSVNNNELPSAEEDTDLDKKSIEDTINQNNRKVQALLNKHHTSENSLTDAESVEDSSISGINSTELGSLSESRSDSLSSEKSEKKDSARRDSEGRGFTDKTDEAVIRSKLLQVDKITERDRFTQRDTSTVISRTELLDDADRGVAKYREDLNTIASNLVSDLTKMHEVELLQKDSGKNNWRTEMVKDALRDSASQEAANLNKIPSTARDTIVTYKTETVGEAQYEWDSSDGKHHRATRQDQNILRTIQHNNQEVSKVISHRLTQSENIPDNAECTGYLVYDSEKIAMDPVERITASNTDEGLLLKNVPYSRNVSIVDNTTSATNNFSVDYHMTQDQLQKDSLLYDLDSAVSSQVLKDIPIVSVTKTKI